MKLPVSVSRITRSMTSIFASINTHVRNMRLTDWANVATIFGGIAAAISLPWAAYTYYDSVNRQNAILATNIYQEHMKTSMDDKNKDFIEDLRSRLQVLFESLEDDEWLDHIRHWRASSRVKNQILDAASDSSFSPQPYVSVTITDFESQNGTYQSAFRVDPRAVDVLVAAPELNKIGVKPIGKTTYQSNDGTIETGSFGLARIVVEEETTAGRVIFGPDKTESIVPQCVIESLGLTVDPVSNSVKRTSPIPPKEDKQAP